MADSAACGEGPDHIDGRSRSQAWSQDPLVLPVKQDRSYESTSRVTAPVTGTRHPPRS